MAFDFAIVNTFFETKVNQFVTYNIEGRKSQIDFLMCRICHQKEVINCKVINGEAVAASVACWLWTGEFNGVRRE